MKSRMALALGIAAMLFSTTGALAQPRGALYQQGFQQGYRCVATGRNCQTDPVERNMLPNQRRVYDQAFRDGAQRARIDHGWAPRR